MSSKFDLLIGVIASLALHGGAVGYGYIFDGKPAPKAPPPKPQQIQSVQLEEVEEEPEPVDPVVKEAIEDVPVDTQQAASLPEPLSFATNQAVTIIAPPTPPKQNFDRAFTSGIPSGDQIKAGAIDKNTSFIDSSLLDKKPAEFRPTPDEVLQFFAQATQDGISGKVVVNVRVDTAGRVVDATVKNSTDRRLERGALQAAKRWRFSPGTRNGKPSSFSYDIPFEI